MNPQPHSPRTSNGSAAPRSRGDAAAPRLEELHHLGGGTAAYIKKRLEHQEKGELHTSEGMALMRNFMTHDIETIAEGRAGGGLTATVDPHRALREHRAIDGKVPKLAETILPMTEEFLRKCGPQPNGPHCTAAERYINRKHRPKLVEARENRLVVRRLLHRNWSAIKQHFAELEAGADAGDDDGGVGADHLKPLRDSVAMYTNVAAGEQARAHGLKNRIVTHLMDGKVNKGSRDVREREHEAHASTTAALMSAASLVSTPGLAHAQRTRLTLTPTPPPPPLPPPHAPSRNCWSGSGGKTRRRRGTPPRTPSTRPRSSALS
jgi:hypothetical protein